ncbi:hypothetical protein NMH_1160 [Neisseria meningitidis H44/76]|uniref:Uncharacterized protein n=1 Tax=Neisseria meningitidis serogroup B / serotype 15 (strain H44/76) TaxID=909420 RepID=E6MWW7_NEIMH|nr:hypothetical protein NMH_1160 [Neisseria meningitidis H44/76]EOB81681.1 hypothetical protein NM98005_2114 [Neisseria meningitidis 98005]
MLKFKSSGCIFLWALCGQIAVLSLAISGYIQQNRHIGILIGVLRK